MLLILAFVLTNIDPFYESIFLFGAVTFLLMYILLLIEDLDNPFSYNHAFSGSRVSRKHLRDTLERLDEDVREMANGTRRTSPRRARLPSATLLPDRTMPWMRSGRRRQQASRTALPATSWSGSHRPTAARAFALTVAAAYRMPSVASFSHERDHSLGRPAHIHPGSKRPATSALALPARGQSRSIRTFTSGKYSLASAAQRLD